MRKLMLRAVKRFACDYSQKDGKTGTRNQTITSQSCVLSMKHTLHSA